jgi:Flp pilus assembly protein TadD
VALCRALSGDRGAARAGLERILGTWPTVRVASIALARLTMDDEPATALVHADGLIEALPDDPIGALLRGRALLRLGRIDDAEAAAKAALALEPKDASARTILSEVHLARGDVPAAAEACREAFEEEPGSAEVRLARARLAVASESREQARRMVEEAVEAAFQLPEPEARLPEETLCLDEGSKQCR